MCKYFEKCLKKTHIVRSNGDTLLALNVCLNIFFPSFSLSFAGLMSTGQFDFLLISFPGIPSPKQRQMAGPAAKMFF